VVVNMQAYSFVTLYYRKNILCQSPPLSYFLLVSRPPPRNKSWRRHWMNPFVSISRAASLSASSRLCISRGRRFYYFCVMWIIAYFPPWNMGGARRRQREQLLFVSLPLALNCSLHLPREMFFVLECPLVTTLRVLDEHNN